MWPQEEKDVGVIASDQAHLSGKQLVWLIWARSLDCCWLGLSLQETAGSVLDPWFCLVNWILYLVNSSILSPGFGQEACLACLNSLVHLLSILLVICLTMFQEHHSHHTPNPPGTSSFCSVLSQLPDKPSSHRFQALPSSPRLPALLRRLPEGSGMTESGRAHSHSTPT